MQAFIRFILNVRRKSSVGILCQSERSKERLCIHQKGKKAHLSTATKEIGKSTVHNPTDCKEKNRKKERCFP